MENRCRFCGGKTELLDTQPGTAKPIYPRYKLVHVNDFDDNHEAAASPSGFTNEAAAERAYMEHQLEQ